MIWKWLNILFLNFKSIYAYSLTIKSHLTATNSNKLESLTLMLIAGFCLRILLNVEISSIVVELTVTSHLLLTDFVKIVRIVLEN